MKKTLLLLISLFLIMILPSVLAAFPTTPYQNFNWNVNSSIWNDTVGNLNGSSRGSWDFQSTGCKLGSGCFQGSVNKYGDTYYNYHNGSFSLCFWGNVTGSNNFMEAGGNAVGSTTNGCFQFWFDTRSSTKYWKADITTSTGSNYAIGNVNYGGTIVNVYNHYCVVYNEFNSTNGNLSTWVNGVVLASVGTTGRYNNTGVNNLTLGRYNNAAQGYIGYMDDYTFFKRALTSTEMLDLYNSGTGLEYSAPDTTLPTMAAPSNQSVTYGTFAGALFNCSDASGISSYWVNDTTNFNITTGGALNKSQMLGVNNYQVNVSCNDTVNNVQSRIFAVNVTQATGYAFSYINNSRANLSTTYTNITTNCTTQGQTNSTSYLDAIYGIGQHNITCSLANSQNYSAASETWVLTITSPPDTTPPTISSPANASIVYGVAWSGVDFNFTDANGTSTAWVNDITNFNITNAGHLDDKISLAVGNYLINVSVNDTYNNIASTTYALNVTKATPSVAQYIGGFRSNVVGEANQNGYSDAIITNCTTVGDTYTSIQNSSNYSVGSHPFTCEYEASQNYSEAYESWTLTITAYNDSISPTFSVIPENATIYHNQTWDGVQFECTDNVGIYEYELKTFGEYFTINESGFLSMNNDTPAGNDYNITVACEDFNGNYANYIYGVIDPAYPYVINETVIIYSTSNWEGHQLQGNVPLTNWNVTNAIFSITPTGFITYNGNLTNGTVSTTVTATDLYDYNATGLFTLDIRTNSGLSIWACPTSDNYWFLYLIVGLILAFLIIAEVMRLRIFGMLGGIGITSLYMFIGACQPLLTIFLPIGGILLVIYYATAD